MLFLQVERYASDVGRSSTAIPKIRLGRQTRITDHRGRVAPICEPAALPDTVSPALRFAVKRANEHRIVHVLMTVVGAFVVAIACRWAFNAAGLRRRPLSPDPPARVIVISVVLGSLLVLITLVAGAFVARRRTTFAMAACLDAGRCPCCCYELTEVPPQADNTTLCPECGAAWRMRTDSDPHAAGRAPTPPR
jgi:hypothetical protein